MKPNIRFFAMLLVAVSCSKGSGTLVESDDQWNGKSVYDGNSVSHEMIELGEHLENPYGIETVRNAYHSLYPTKAREDVVPNRIYVRFLPDDEKDFKLLESMGVEMLDHPVDYRIKKEGDYYHDPSIAEDRITWQYAVVPTGFDFPSSIRHEIIQECYVTGTETDTKASGTDWEAVEKEAYRLSGNMGIYESMTKASGAYPKGRVTVVDDRRDGGKPVGVAGVKVSCNVFVKFASAYTDRDGYYSMPKQFSSKVRYRLIFENEKSFSIGFNFILVPASVSTLGKGSPEGLDVEVNRYSESKLFKRCVVNNSAYDYITRCSEDDMNLLPPPSDLRIWMFHSLEASSAVMIHHGAIVSHRDLAGYLGFYAPIVQFFAPDITIGTSGRDDYAGLYDATCHELSHASHFSQVGTNYWNDYIKYVVTSFLWSGGKTYGDGQGDYAGHCEVGEMWAYFMESLMHKERYGGALPGYGNSNWFFPQILRYLSERGFSKADIFAALRPDVSGRDALEAALRELYPEKASIVAQAFARYK